MEKQRIKSFRSRRNRVELIQTDEGRVVIKAFFEESSFQKELQIYRSLQDSQVTCPKLIAAEDKLLMLSPLPGQTLVDVLQQQEQTGVINWDVWEKLTDWLLLFWQHTGLVMTDVNLRNFMYDENTNMLYGLDFEQCREAAPEECAATLAAFIRTYRPENTPLKHRISQFVLTRFAKALEVEMDILCDLSARQEREILQRRKNRKS